MTAGKLPFLPAFHSPFVGSDAVTMPMMQNSVAFIVVFCNCRQSVAKLHIYFFI